VRKVRGGRGGGGGGISRRWGMRRMSKCVCVGGGEEGGNVG